MLQLKLFPLLFEVFVGHWLFVGLGKWRLYDNFSPLGLFRLAGVFVGMLVNTFLMHFVFLDIDAVLILP